MQDLSRDMRENHPKTFSVEREYLGKYTPEEFMKRIIKSHMEEKEILKIENQK